MALNAQRNWDVEMAEDRKRRQNLEGPSSGDQTGKHDSVHDSDISTSDVQKKAECDWSSQIFLPDEVLLQILDYVAKSHSRQHDLASCCLLSHQWYQVAVPLLYARPYLYGNNFDPFVRSICPSINLHVRKSPLSELVKVLDMGRLVHQGSKSLTARILGRVKGQLEVFVAPQASFAVNCFPALSKCQNLQELNLSLVSESPPLPELFKTIAHLGDLRAVKLPRSAGFGVHYKTSALEVVWPPKLEILTLSGGIDAHFLHGLVAFPQTLRKLTIEHCPQAKGYAIMRLLKTAVRPLRKLEMLKIANMPRLSSHALDEVLFLLPQLKKLSVSVDYITPALFDDTHYHHFKYPALDGHPALAEWPSSDDHVSDLTEDENVMQHGLSSLELTNSGNPGVEDKISPIDVIIAIDEGTLPKLREVRVAKSLLWGSSSMAADAEALADALQEGSKRDWQERASVFANMPNEKYHKDKVWEDVAGVWQFDG